MGGREVGASRVEFKEVRMNYMMWVLQVIMLANWRITAHNLKGAKNASNLRVRG
jgi:hypothetical protein